VTDQRNILYEFAFRGLLAEEALDQAGRRPRSVSDFSDEAIATSVSLDLLDDDLATEARRMSVVYTAIAAFENSVRALITRVLLEKHGESWWDTCVPDRVRNRAKSRLEGEERVKWHTQRGNDPINYIEFGDLISIVCNNTNWDEFEPYLHSADWAKSILKTMEQSRNVIMHSGSLERADIERVGIHIRDWIKQVGA